MFDRATRLKLRFTTPVGKLSVEDLWDLPLKDTRGPNLNDVAKAVHRNLKEDEEVDFVSKKTPSASINNLRMDIVKHIIQYKLDAEATAEKRAANKEKKKVLLDIIADKENEKLKDMSVEDLKNLAQNM